MIKIENLSKEEIIQEISLLEKRVFGIAMHNVKIIDSKNGMNRLKYKNDKEIKKISTYYNALITQLNKLKK